MTRSEPLRSIGFNEPGDLREGGGDRGGPPGEEEEEKRMQWCAKVAANFAPGQPCPRQ